jgi:uncharacterized protein
MKQTLVFCLLIFIIANNCLAQAVPQKAKVNGRGMYTGDVAILRWIPADYETWKWANKFGYRVERQIIAIDGQKISPEESEQSLKIIDEKITPFPENDWKPIAEVFRIAAIGAAALYSPEFLVQATAQSEYLTAYNKSLERENRFNFILFAADQQKEIARAAGLYIEDTGLENNILYQYKISVNNGDKKFPRENAYISINTSDVYVLPIIEGAEAQAADKKATIKWSRGNLDSYFSSYYIQKANEIDGNYITLNEQPLVPMTTSEKDPFMYYSDVLEENGKPYFYRIIGKSPFGFQSEPSAPIKVIGKVPPLDASPFIHNVKEYDKGKLTIEWSFPEEKIGKIKSYSIFKSENIDGPYSVVVDGLPTSEVKFIDENVPKPSYYYILRAIDENDNELNSFASLGQLKDDEAPVPPTGLKCASDKTGLVTISWDPNSEEDILGYRVFFSNNPDYDYSQITKVSNIAATFQDQLPLNVLNELIYYKVIAVDYHQNYSVLSEACIMQRPDVIPPNNPILTQAEATIQGVELTWITSKSKDIANHILQRKADFETDWNNLAPYPPQNMTFAFIDSTAQKEQTYSYRLLAYDKAANIASSNVMMAIPVRDPAASNNGSGGNGNNGGTNGTNNPNIKGQITLKPYFAPDYIELSWIHTVSTVNEYFLIYRKDSVNQTTTLLSKLAATSLGVKNTFTFKDNNVQIGVTYTYEIQLCGVSKNCFSFGSATILFDPKGAGNAQNRALNFQSYANSKPLGVKFDWVYTPQTQTQSVEIYRRLAGVTKSFLISTVPMVGKNNQWTFTDNTGLVAANAYEYEFKLCDGQTSVCQLLPQELKVDLAISAPDVISAFANKFPNYINIQWTGNTATQSAQLFALEREDSNGNVVTVGTIAAPNLPNDDYFIRDSTAIVGEQYTYTVKMCAIKGACNTTVASIKIFY